MHKIWKKKTKKKYDKEVRFLIRLTKEHLKNIYERKNDAGGQSKENNQTKTDMNALYTRSKLYNMHRF